MLTIRVTSFVWLCLLALPLEAATFTVRMPAGRQFSPVTVDIRAGDTVVWRNDDNMDHTSTSGLNGNPDGLWDSGNMPPGATFSHTFGASGSFDYYCDYHSGMVGKVVVWPASSALIESRSGRVFVPATVNLAVADTAIWVNVDTMDHTATSGSNETADGLWNSGNLAPGQTFAHTFPVAGTFDYFCEYHGGMVGSVIVSASPASVILKSRRSLADVSLEWVGGAAPWDLRRGQMKDLSDLATISAPSTPTATDSGAVATPPSLLFYDVR